MSETIGVVEKTEPDNMGFLKITWRVEPTGCAKRCDLCLHGCSGEIVNGKTIIDAAELLERRASGQSTTVACDILENI